MLSFTDFLTEAKADSFSGTLYHGTGFAFDKFDQKKARITNDLWGGGLAYLTSDTKVAITYAKSTAKSAKTNTPYVYNIKCSFDKVFDVDEVFTGKALTDFLPKDRKSLNEFARAAGLLELNADEHMIMYKLESGKLELTGEVLFRGLSKAMSQSAKARNILISKGYDALRYNGGVNMKQSIKHDVYIAYKASSMTFEKRMKVVKKDAKK